MKREEQLLDKFLSTQNLRGSAKRSIILKAFLAEEGHITAEGLYKKVVKKDPSLGLATVYRNLKLFREAGLARMSRFGKNEAYYEHDYMHGHHDHLVCLSCGSIVEFENPDIEEIQERTAERYQFKITSHRLELYGRCAECGDSDST